MVHRPWARRALAALLCFGLSAAYLIEPAFAQSPEPTATAFPSPASTPNASAAYAKMILAMRAQPVPSGAVYDETFNPRGLGLRIIEVRGEAVLHLAFSSNGAPHLFHVRECGGRDTAEIVDAGSGQRYTAERPFWSVTWPAVHSTEESRSTPADRTTVISSVREEMVSDLLGTSDDAYSVSFAGVENLDGSSVYHLHLTARRDAAVHPLTDVFVDGKSYLVRRVIADFSDDTGANVTGTVTLNFGRIGKFWVVTSGAVDATVHALFREVSGSATFAASHAAFPPGTCRI